MTIMEFVTVAFTGSLVAAGAVYGVVHGVISLIIKSWAWL